MSQKIPTKLYHYTSIEGLANILSSQSIRFSSLSVVDDLEDGDNADLQQLKNFFFVSCWTSQKQESLPFWNMYTPKMEGVRIELPANPFLEKDIVYKGKFNVNKTKSIFDSNQVFGLDYIIMPIEDYLVRIKYTSKAALLKPSIMNRVEFDDREEVSLEFSKYAVYKRNHWRFQNEWRYVAVVLPLVAGSEYHAEDLVEFYNGNYHNVSAKYLYAKLNPELFNEIKIVLGPKCDEAHSIIVNSLTDKYCKRAKISKSVLTNKLRRL